SSFAINLKNALTEHDGHLNIKNRFAIATIAGATHSAQKSLKKADDKLIFAEEFFGIPSQRADLTLKLYNIFEKNTEHGLKNIYYFVDSKHRRFKWMCWGDNPSVDMTIGTTYSIKATISKHENYSSPTTAINRCKVQGVVQDDPSS